MDSNSENNLDFIPKLSPNYENVDQEKIAGYVLKCFEMDKNNVINNKIVVHVSLDESGLTRKELEIAKGIILVNGHDYYEMNNKCY